MPVSKPAVAEMTKLLENIYRSVNIALVNELKQLCARMGIDIFEVIEAAKTKPSDSSRSIPGRGWAATAFRSIRSISRGRRSSSTSRRGSLNWRERSTGGCRITWWMRRRRR